MDTFTNFYSRTIKLSEHKFIELESMYSGQHLFRFSLDLNWRGEDHAGPEIELGVWGHEVRLKLYDHRHWNTEKNRWYQGTEEWDLMSKLEEDMMKAQYNEDKYYK